ncbi:hypothetical protein HHK36_029178 [Tetracentron sinense]|uniref:Importin N-terminal domain-containing protein n=1 Tax=Tetracentron sinense TaxID=13715 RepID=A0A834YCT5_TETSI|nr:hypothetical protein HHK36_029178 [Tetracentron sinense]
MLPSNLAEASDRPNFCLAVLRLVSEPSIDEQIRQAAVVNFKNHLRSRWAPNLPSDSNIPAVTPIPDPEKEQIKTLIVPLMLSSGPRIQSQLSEALAASVNGILGTANSIFKKFRYQYKTNDLLLDLKYCLDNFAAPLLEIFLRTASLIDSAASSGGAAVTFRPLFESQRLCCRIFYSLNFQELPEFFEDHMKEWMTEFRKYLTTTYPALEKGGGDGLALVDELLKGLARRRIACELLKGLATNYKEQVTSMVSAQIQNMLASFAANPAVNWKEKDCAIYLVVSLATKKAGGNSVSTDLVDVHNFFGLVIVPELQSQDVNGYPILKAGALKFFTMFRNQISKPAVVALMPDVVRFIGSESNVVHSYAGKLY